MSAFTGDLDVRQLADWRTFVLLSPLVYEVGGIGSGRLVEVGPGFETDGATVPRPLWWAVPPWGVSARAAVIHDFLLARLLAGRPHPEGPTRLACDRVYREALAVSGVPMPLRALLYAGVRLRSLGLA